MSKSHIVYVGIRGDTINKEVSREISNAEVVERYEELEGRLQRDGAPKRATRKGTGAKDAASPEPALDADGELKP